MVNMFRVTYGGWYQRTTIHLSEIYDLLARGSSNLEELSKEKLEEFRKSLNFEVVDRRAGYLEYVFAKTKDGIEIRYYEDGLYVLEMESLNVFEAKEILTNFYEEKLGPAISYIFSLGAPTPKILANIKTIHPVVIRPIGGKVFKEEEIEKLFGEIYSKISTKQSVVYKMPEYIFVMAKTTADEKIRGLVEGQIFFREFKDHLEKYLNIHRHVWEDITSIKDRRYLVGKKISATRNELDSLQKTISLISSRINQMGVYINTRASIAKRLNIEDDISVLFQYKFEVLIATLAYIKEVWKMTTDYLQSAIAVVNDVGSRTTNVSIQSLRLITTIGVVSGIMGYMSKTEFPKITLAGFVFFMVLLLTTYLINLVIGGIYKNRRYKLNFGERVEDI